MHHTNTMRIRTASKFGRDGTSLRLRRIWYAETNANGQEAQGGTDENATASDGKPWTLESAMAEIGRLRKENKDRRLSEDTLTQQAKEAAAQAALAAKTEQERLAALGQWEQLAKQRETELAQYKPYQERATTLEKLITESNRRRIEQIPESLRSLVPDGSAEAVAAYLDKNWAILQRKAAPETDAGAGQGGSGKAALTDEEKAMARQFNLTDEQYANAKPKTS